MKPFFNFTIRPGNTNTATENIFLALDSVLKKQLPKVADFIFNVPTFSDTPIGRYLELMKDERIEMAQYDNKMPENGDYGMMILSPINYEVLT